MVGKVIDGLIARDNFIDSCESVMNKVYEADVGSKQLIQHPRGHSRYFINKTDVNKVMKDLGMRYRKVTHIANTANATTSQVLR